MSPLARVVVTAVAVVVLTLLAAASVGQELERRACVKVPAACEVTP